MKRLKRIGYVIVGVLILLVAGYIYSLFSGMGNSGSTNIVLLILGVLLGGSIVFFAANSFGKNRSETAISSHTIVESMRKVFKIVFAEGQFQEIYNYSDTKRIFKFIPTTKKALVIIKAKVLVGYDFEKCKWELDEESKTMRIIHFPEPEIISIEQDYNYYQIEEDMFSVFNKYDIEKIQTGGKKQIEKAALQSGLQQIAADQMLTLLTEVLTANQWKIANPEKLKLSQ